MAATGVIYGSLGHGRALRAVLADGTNRGVTSWVSLGGVVGHFPEWKECLSLLTSFAVRLRASVDDLVVIDRPFVSGSPMREAAILATRRSMSPPEKGVVASWPTFQEYAGVVFCSDLYDQGVALDKPAIGLRAGASSYRAGEYLDGRLIRFDGQKALRPGMAIFPGCVAKPLGMHEPSYLILEEGTVAAVSLAPMAMQGVTKHEPVS